MLTAMKIDSFQTPRLTARRFTSEGLPLQKILLTDPGTMKTLAADGTMPSDERIAELCARHLQHWARYGFGMWQIFETTTGEYIGQCGLRNSAIRGNPEIELFFALRSPYFQRGFGTEMARAAIRIAFGELSARSVIAFTLPDNIASRRLMQKVGMQYECMIEHAGLPHVLYRARSDAAIRLPPRSDQCEASVGEPDAK
jgi:RimJ/RimL family protein N-acetyltransferase